MNMPLNGQTNSYSSLNSLCNWILLLTVTEGHRKSDNMHIHVGKNLQLLPYQAWALKFLIVCDQELCIKET